MGDRGRLVVPAKLRKRTGFREGDVLVFVETSYGLLLLTREEAKDLVRNDLRDQDLVGELLMQRRRDASAEDDMVA